MCAAAEVPVIRIYDLRHTAATLMLASGVNVKVVSDRLGHATVMITLQTYAHVLPTMQEDAALRMEAVLRGGAAKPNPEPTPLPVEGAAAGGG
jgi:integrase